jgi:hypothetical protein
VKKDLRKAGYRIISGKRLSGKARNGMKVIKFNGFYFGFNLVVR